MNESQAFEFVRNEMIPIIEEMGDAEHNIENAAISVDEYINIIGDCLTKFRSLELKLKVIQNDDKDRDWC